MNLALTKKTPKKAKATKVEEKPPRNANGEGSVFQRTSGRHKGKYFAQVTIGNDSKTGKLKYKTIMCESRAEAKRIRNELLQELKDGIDLQGQAKLTLESWIVSWMDKYRINLDLLTLENNYRQIKTHILPEIGHILLKDLTTDDIQTFYINMVKEGLAPATVRKNHQILNTSLKQAVANHLINSNPATNAVVPKLGDQVARAMTEEEMDIFLAALETIKGPFKTRRVWQVIFLTLLGTGLRLGEGLALRWGNVNLRKRTANVEETLKRTKKEGLIFTDPKTKKSRREVPLPAEAAFALRLHRIHQARFRLASGEEYQNQNLVFCTSKGTPIEPRGLIRAFHRIRDNAKLPKDLTVHSLRHTYATRLLELGVSLKVVSELMGHSNIATTANIYSHVLPKIKTEAASKINGLLKNKKVSPKQEKIQAPKSL